MGDVAHSCEFRASRWLRSSSHGPQGQVHHATTSTS